MNVVHINSLLGLAFLIASYCNEIELTQDVPGKQIAKEPYVFHEWWKRRFTGWDIFNLKWQERSIRDRIIDDLCFRLHTNLFKTNANKLVPVYSEDNWNCTWPDGSEYDIDYVEIREYNPFEKSNIPFIIEELCPLVREISKHYEAGNIKIKESAVVFAYGKKFIEQPSR